MIQRKDIQEIGKFLKTHGLKGELNAVFDIDADFVTPDRPLILDVDGIYVPFYCSAVRPKGEFSSLVSLEGVGSGDDARRFVNKVIYAMKSDLEEYDDEAEDEDFDDDDEGEYADAMVGYRLVDVSQGEVGTIRDFMMAGDNPLFVVETRSGDEVLIPVAEEFFVSIDEEQGVVEMNLPQGLLDLNSK